MQEGICNGVMFTSLMRLGPGSCGDAGLAPLDRTDEGGRPYAGVSPHELSLQQSLREFECYEFDWGAAVGQAAAVGRWDPLHFAGLQAYPH
jgi:hypothetical protein